MRPRIAICFFGITRSLHLTRVSIEKNVINAAMELGDVKIFGHFFQQTEIRNARSREFVTLEPNQHLLLPFDTCLTEEPEHFLEKSDFSSVCKYGDIWDDDYKSLKNLLHQLHSLGQVADLASDWGPNIYIFCRPDLLYHDDFSSVLTRCAHNRFEGVVLPNWQQWHGGYNDRFAICFGTDAAVAYGRRGARALEMCNEQSSSLHSERLLKYVLSNPRVPVQFTSLRASRVRADGRVERESFHGPSMILLKKILKSPFTLGVTLLSKILSFLRVK